MAFEKYRGAATAVIEAVGAFPGQGVHSMFVFGMHYGMLQMALTAANIPFEKVAPVTWKKNMGLARAVGKTDRKERKRLSRELAQRYYPDQEGINDATSEALLLAHYCQELHKRGAYATTHIEKFAAGSPRHK